MTWCPICECLELFGVGENVRTFLIGSIANWKLELTSCWELLGDIEVRSGIFQGESLSPLFNICPVYNTTDFDPGRDKGMS